MTGKHDQSAQETLTKLAEEVRALTRENMRLKTSLSLAVGTALVEARTIKGLVRLPGALFSAFRRHRLKKRGHSPNPRAPAPRSSTSEIPAPGIGRPASNSLNLLGWPDNIVPGRPRILSVLDEFSRECFSPHANLIEPRPDNWRELLLRDRPQVVLIESAWRGNGGSWQYRIASYTAKPGNELQDLVTSAKSLGIPTVFWNKEDPVHFDRFAESAQLFDVVLTTASEAQSRYERLGVPRVDILPFAAEKSLHNPIGSKVRNQRVCFAGSYYNKEFPGRSSNQEILLDAASHFELDIFDRNHGVIGNSDESHVFPARFRPFIRGRLSYAAISKAYREYSVFLNVNSVEESPTMFSRRVFELLACGTPVVSTPGRGMDALLGDGAVWVVRNQKEAHDAIAALLSDRRLWQAKSLAGIRTVFSGHTFDRRLAKILSVAGLDAYTPGEARVLVVVLFKSASEFRQLEQAYARQRVSGGRTFLMAVGPISEDVASSCDWRIDSVRQDWRSQVLDTIKANSISHCCVLSGLGVYGGNFLTDLLHASHYSDAEFVGKAVGGGDHYEYGVELIEGTVLLNVAALIKRGLLAGDVFEESGRHRAVSLGARTFAPDGANYVAVTDTCTTDQQKRLLAAVEA